jgi:hypothetical protein
VHPLLSSSFLLRLPKGGDSSPPGGCPARGAKVRAVKWETGAWVTDSRLLVHQEVRNVVIRA